jgi:naphthoate synthase
VIGSEKSMFGQTGAKVGACPTVGATQYLPRIVGERIAREMIFLAKRFEAKEAECIGLINKCVPEEKLMEETLAWCENIKSNSSQTIRMTKKSLNFESDQLYRFMATRYGIVGLCLGFRRKLRRYECFPRRTQT